MAGVVPCSTCVLCDVPFEAAEVAHVEAVEVTHVEAVEAEGPFELSLETLSTVKLDSSSFSF